MPVGYGAARKNNRFVMFFSFSTARNKLTIHVIILSHNEKEPAVCGKKKMLSRTAGFVMRVIGSE